MTLTLPFKAYILFYLLACVLAGVLLYKKRRSLELFKRDYWQLLFQPWKVVTFVVGTIGMAVIAPYTGDPTWDYYDSTMMCVLAYLTAPWAIGTLFLKLRGKTSWTKTYIAACVWMFTVSWSYDLYMLLKDGYYPMTWLPNIFASSVIYVCAGMMWSLEWYEGKGVVFSFMQPSWPERVAQSRPGKIMLYALPVVVFVVALTVPFLL
ncbi:MAG: hypothetical protein C0615_06540 [Desulfuromonas sp.]|nr:MAG: hypothetical protein C0615_06540 [Desulfuromonas sp.]